MAVLLAYNGKPEGEKVLDYAIGYATAYSSPLYILSSVASKDVVDSENELNHIKGYLDTARQKASGRGVETFTLIGVGPPGEEIIAAAERIDAEAIIVGYSDKTAISRVLLGTVSEHVLRKSGRTVIIVH